MKTIIEYIEENFNTFEEKSFNQVDSLILSNLCYVNLEELFKGKKLKDKIKIKDILKSELFEKMLDGVREHKLYIKFIIALSASPRFRDIEIGYYMNKTDVEMCKQFSAMTFYILPKEIYIAFRGTDSTLVGWKEDLNMSFTCPVPAQEEAVEYTQMVMSKLPRYMAYLGGHSKGGNLAVYALVKCLKKFQQRIKFSFSHDGPGFRDEFINSLEFNNIKYKIRKTVPQSSIVGMILQTQEKYQIVKSNRIGIMQHEPFSWGIEGEDFVYAEQLSNSSEYTNRALSMWLHNMSDEKRKLFTDTIFEILGSTNASRMDEISSSWQKNIPIMLNTIKNMDDDVKSAMGELLKELSKYSISSFEIKGIKNQFVKKSNS